MLACTHSYYSLRYGVLSTKKLIEVVTNAGFSTITLTDINTTSTCLDFVRIAKQEGVKPIIGVDFRNGVRQQFVAIAKNNAGFEEINHFLSNLLAKKELVPEKAPLFNNVFIIYPYSSYGHFELSKNEYIGITPLEISKYQRDLKKDISKFIYFPTFTFRNKKDFNAHRLLRAIDNNTLLSKLDKSEEADYRQKIHTKEKALEYCSDVNWLLKNNLALAKKCSIDFEFGTDITPKNLATYTGSTTKDIHLLKKLCFQAIQYRYPKPNKAIYERIEKELKLIQEKKFVAYFLINWDIVSYATSKGYCYVGRGSGANSIIAYLLKITDVDPIELDLYFERFINLYRKNPPDFDIDFSWKDRDDVTRYIFKRFENTALLATYNTFQYRAVVRELGKVFGLPAHEIDLLTKGGFDVNKLDHIAKLVLKYSTYIKGFPSHLSIHAGGILIADRPIQYYSATFMPPKGFPTTHFDMIIAEDVGLYKFDILSQRGLAKIKEAVALIEKNHPNQPKIDIHDIAAFKQDENVKSLLKNADAIGCFYVESPAMRMLLAKLKVDSYLGLVAASSVIRPGVAQSGMMQEYIRRFRNPERRKLANPTLLEIMPETYGVMVYQEDVIKVAHYYGGLTLGEADMLRRGMSGKFRSRDEFQKVKIQFFTNALANNRPEKEVNEIWRQIESFAGYAFSKGHSASYAVESYQCLFLKAYFPLEYMVATINNFGGFYATRIYIHEAKMLGGIIHFPCINQSELYTSIKGKDIYLGFILAHSIDSKCVQNIIEERCKNGAYTSLINFLERVAISTEQIILLIRTGAFRFTGRNKRELLWEAHFFNNPVKSSQKMNSLFPVDNKSFELPTFIYSHLEEAFDQLELFGFTSIGMFSLLKENENLSLTKRDFPALLNKEITLLGEMVHVKRTSTIKGDMMCFGTFIDSNGHFFDTTHFPPAIKKFPFRGKGIYVITGKVVEEFEFMSIEVSAMYKQDLIEDPRYKEENKFSSLKKAV